MIENLTKSNSKNPKKLDFKYTFNVKNPKKLDFWIFVGFFWIIGFDWIFLVQTCCYRQTNIKLIGPGDVYI
jgi:hypothetical protein